MAEIIVTKANGQQYVVAASNEYVFGRGNDEVVSSVLFHLVPGDSWNGSVTVKARAGGAESLTPVAIPYRNLHQDGTVGDGDFDTAALTSESIIVVENTGLDVVLDITVNAGTLLVYAFKRKG